MNLGNNLGKDLGYGNVGYNLGKTVKFVNNGNSLRKNLRFEKIDYNLGKNLGYGNLGYNLGFVNILVTILVRILGLRILVTIFVRILGTGLLVITMVRTLVITFRTILTADDIRWYHAAIEFRRNNFLFLGSMLFISIWLGRT